MIRRMLPGGALPLGGGKGMNRTTTSDNRQVAAIMQLKIRMEIRDQRSRRKSPMLVEPPHSIPASISPAVRYIAARTSGGNGPALAGMKKGRASINPAAASS